MKVLERYRERCHPDELAEFARLLREYADGLEKSERDKKRAKG